MHEQHIIELLKQTKEQALAIYSNFHVGAVLITKEDQLITGFNIESSSYGLTLCAERVALFKALSEGFRDFKTVYIMADGAVPCPPCGACRQLLMDYAPGIKIIMVSESGTREEYFLKELLPQAFDGKKLPSR